MTYKYDINTIQQTLLKSDYQEILFGDLKKLKKESNGQYIACCPFHDDENPSFSISADKPLWNCHGCGEDGNWVQYLEKKEGLNFKEALHKLAIDAGVKMKDDPPKIEKTDIELMEAALNYYQVQIKTTLGKRTVKHLKQRGFKEDDIASIGFGYNPGGKAVTEYLTGLGFSFSQINQVMKYINYRDDYEVVIPYRDLSGNIASIWGRNRHPDDGNKYKPFTSGATKDTLFNMDQVKGDKSIIVTEGFFDALLATARGVKVVAVIGSSITKNQIKSAKELGVEHMVLAFDADKAGIDGTANAVSSLMEAKISSSVIEYTDEMSVFGAKLDPAQLICNKGIEVFSRAITTAIDGIEWKYRNFKKELYWEKGEGKKVKEMVSFILSLPDDLKSRYKELTERTFPESKEMFGEPNSTSIDPFLQTKQNTQSSLSEHLKQKFDVESVRECDLLGYKMISFKNVCKYVDGIQPGFYLLSAETSVGKTACLTNMFIDLILANPDVKGIYFSLDDNRDVIINRLLGFLTDIPLNQIQRKQENTTNQMKLVQAYDSLISLSDQGRLDIKDLSEVDSISKCEKIIRENVNRPLFVVIDGLYNLEIEGNQSTREMNIDRANRIKTLVDIHKIPVICSGELRKKTTGDNSKKPPTLHDIMETGKLAYNANIVWLLYPKNISSFSTDDEPELVLEFAKNKLSFFRSTIDLKFVRKTGKIIEI
jgi:DNA primase catalytic core